MNKPSHPAPPFTPASPPYELDVYGWALAQAELLRHRRVEDVDLDNIIEEIRSVGESQARRVESALRVLIMHVLKWQQQPEKRTRSWALSIAEQRARFDIRMRKNPSLKPELDELRADAHRRARLAAARETGLPLRMFPQEPPSWTVLLEEPFGREDD